MIVSPDALTTALSRPLPGRRAHRSLLPPGRPVPQRPSGMGKVRHSAVLLALAQSAHHELEFPLIQRSDDGGVHALQISLPGGAAEPTDTSIVDTALREAREEIGLPSGFLRVLGTLSDLYIDVSGFLITPVVAWYGQPEPERTLWPHLSPHPDEVRRILRGRVAVMRASRADRAVQARQVTLTVPSYEVETDHGGETGVVWGATAMILAEFFAVLETLEASDASLHRSAGRR